MPTGHYKQTVTLPAGFDYDTVDIKFRLADGTIIFPTVEKVSDTQYTIYTIDSSLAFTAVHGG